ncbi:hypothetical protein [Streptomyces yaizuensis]|uniref:Replication/maintenance protein RepL n=1 Tax=Streptomyces yaizuensis TaxID=2989713 RepID=A0AA86JGD0_9ACTN|nr:hypothetical protein [Streptomyces sp. YSPA8]BDT39514.1 replication/maintenance protein RepL [Streptomyces sp. YSPA8]
MAQARRSSAGPAHNLVRQRPRLVPLPPSTAPAAPDPARQTAFLLKSLEKIAERGGIIQADPVPRAYAFPSKRHITFDADIHDNLWRFGLTPIASALLGHMAAGHDKDGVLVTTQSALAQHFECHHTRINRAFKLLDRHNFAWKERQGRYQINPQYAYRWGSRKHRALIERMGTTLKTRTIAIPKPETRTR